MSFTRKAKKAMALIAACHFLYPAYSQDSTHSAAPISLECKVHKGFFITNLPKAVYVRDSYSSFAEVNISKQTDGKEYWQQVNNYPRVGIAAFYGNTGSRQYIGHMAGIFPYVNFPFYNSALFRAGFRLGTGIAWIQKPYDAETNYKNLMIGSHLNSCISMLLEAELKIARHFAINGGISFTHISNGLCEVPNLGLNIPALSAGIRYRIAEPAVYRTQKPPVSDRRIHWQVFALAAIKEGPWIASPHYLVSTIQTEAVLWKIRENDIAGGFMFTSDPSLTREIKDEPLLTFDDSKPKYQAALYASYERRLGRLSIPLQAGVYVYNNYPINSAYQVIGLRYALTGHLRAAFQLKTHMGKADHIDWGLGYRF